MSGVEGVEGDGMSTPTQRADERTDDEYEAPRLTDYGTIEAWTRGGFLADGISISIVI